MNPTRVQICSLMARKRLTVERVLDAMDPDWEKQDLDSSQAFDEYIRYMSKDLLETVRGL